MNVEHILIGTFPGIPEKPIVVAGAGTNVKGVTTAEEMRAFARDLLDQNILETAQLFVATGELMVQK